ncbi:DMT family transporter [Chromobacterium subtsugae]|uniref:DMT family transporter n=1 Tax=Chromobacterium subtsugae TaxID=251747 RepID=UPI0006413163|nr:DMT family transporter [Chromobacterium subtsugae]
MPSHPLPARPLSDYALAALALSAGALLALMIHCNSRLAAASDPLTASWIAHAAGAFAAWLLWAAWRRPGPAAGPAPRWAYLGGVPGALTVALAAIAVNSPLGLAGTLALAMVGQVLFGLLADHFGWFGMPRRRLGRSDALAALLVLAGCAMLIFGA